MSVVEPRLTLERQILRERALVIACDEVGRGALAGPVAVGAAVVDAPRARKRVPKGLRDSKLVPPARRHEVAARAAEWTLANAVGWASAPEIDEVGIIRALGLATRRAIATLAEQGIPIAEAVIILDGNHDYISAADGGPVDVRTVVKADRDCASAAAASVIAKVARDDLMVRLHEEFPAYRWAQNKGYASAEHRAAIASHGISRHHRASWSLTHPATLF